MQDPDLFFENLINRERIFLQLKTHRIKEYLNITRCYKCHGYGHIAKMCKVPDQLCENCDCKDHASNEYPKKNNLQCINCMKNKQDEVNHSVKSRKSVQNI